MCGRYALFQSDSKLAKLFKTENKIELKPRYNIAPTQDVATVNLDKETGKREIKLRHWGLIPSWAKDKSMSAKLINARAETVAEKPSFRTSFRQRRCLIIADGFYEWQKSGTKKQPFYIHLEGDRPFAFAGLQATWQNPDNEEEIIESCTIITTAANEVMAPVHERMPVILSEKDYDIWLDYTQNNPDELFDLLRGVENSNLSLKPVSTRVNNARYDCPDCLNE